MQKCGVLSIQSNHGQSYLHYSGHQTKSINGVGISVKKTHTYTQVNFGPISDRICKITIKLTNSCNKLIIISLYPPKLECSEKDPDTAEFYTKLESVIKRIKSGDTIVITGNFNAKTGAATLESNIYIYIKEKQQQQKNRQNMQKSKSKRQ